MPDIQGPFTKKPPNPIRWLYLAGLVLLFTMAFFLTLAALDPAPSASTEAQNETPAYAPDPCGLNDVECPEEASQDQSGPQEVIYATVYTYQAVSWQTDADPCTTASGFDACTHWDGKPAIVANNCLPFGTEVVIRGDVYEVQDRMNSRYNCEAFDIPTDGDNWTWINEPVEVL